MNRESRETRAINNLLRAIEQLREARRNCRPLTVPRSNVNAAIDNIIDLRDAETPKAQKVSQFDLFHNLKIKTICLMKKILGKNCPKI